MRKMKDSGIDWLREIPSDWTTVRTLYVLAMPITDGPHTTPELYEEGIPFVSAEAISFGNGSIDFEHIRGFISEEFYNECCKKYIPQRDDIYMIKSGATTGTVSIVDTDMVFTIWSPLAVFRCNKLKMLPKYMFYSLFADYFQKQVQQAWSYGTQQNIGMRVLEHLKICAPSLKEQLVIADYLDKKCAEINLIFDDIEGQIGMLERYKQSVITETVTKGLNADEEMKDSGIEWIGEIPVTWEVMANKYVMHKVKEICPVYNGEDILSLTMQGVIVRDLDAGGKMPKSFDGYQKVHMGNLLMCLFDIDVTPRCVGLVKNEGLTSPAYSQFVLEERGCAAYYCYYYMMLDNDKTLLHLAKNLRHSLTDEQFGTIATIVPPILEQKKIADFLDDKCAKIDSIIADKNKQLATLAEYKKSLIYEYVTGKKEVQDA